MEKIKKYLRYKYMYTNKTFLVMHFFMGFKWNIIHKIVIITIAFIYIIGYNSIALVVSDDDGEAFVTKKDFEMMKKRYEQSVEKYKNSLSEKIEGAILNYLAGKTRWVEYIDQKVPVSILSYPLTVYNNEYDITLEKWQNATTPLWAPSINHLGIYQNVGTSESDYITYMFKLNYDRLEKNANKINNFYNIVEYSATDDGDCCIDGVLNDFNCINSYNEFYCNALNWKMQDNYKLLIRQDQDSSPDMNGIANGTWIVRDEYVDLFSSAEFPQDTFTTAYFNNNTGAITFTDYFSKWVNYALYSKAISNEIQKQRSKNTVIKKYNKVEALNKVYNVNDNNMLFPVAYNTNVYYTNKKSLKENIKSVATIEEGNYYRNIANTRKNTIEDYITAGWTIEPEGINETREWYKTSLIHANRVYYKVQLPNSNAIKKQSILKGFIAGDMPNKELNKGRFEIDVNFENDDNDKYLIMSKSEIIESNPDDWDTSSDFVNISDSEKDLESNVNVKVKLKEGKNIIYLNGLTDGDVLYYKIIWEPNDKSYVKINTEPLLYYLYV